ncbi:anti-sigma factor [Mesonia ostreae]|uniref:Anti-sigma factor n=1 Tax=Mesonia ostreae TaxID=861110 RepID=A0ABU2KLW4_9FLAO|nr:anti-sigma factor [Mesonia ostreae]MDT0295664.1 anti-sigma factor [Mesonia ostreae]
MNIQEYISSGVLELYICGALTEEESKEVSTELKKYPEIEKEVEQIENSLLQLSSAVAPYDPVKMYAIIKNKLHLEDNPKTIPIHRKKKKSNIVLYLGWAASIALLIGLFSVLNDRNQLRENLNVVNAQKAQMEQQIDDANASAEKKEELLSIFRDKNILTVPLEGQKVAPEAYAAVHWDKATNKVYIDAKNLPTPPEDKEYQVWSLTLEPLTPTSIGMLSSFTEDENKIFMLDNTNSSQAFGITLEPKGGSKTPTMEQLYTLGMVKNS